MRHWPESTNEEKKDEGKSIDKTMECEEDVLCLQPSILWSDPYIADQVIIFMPWTEETCGWQANRKKGEEKEQVMNKVQTLREGNSRIDIEINHGWGLTPSLPLPLF